MKQKLTALGRNKSATVTVNFTPGNGLIFINGRSEQDYFMQYSFAQQRILQPFLLVSLPIKYDLFINAKGGGKIAQIRAIQLAVSRFISSLDPSYRLVLKDANQLTRSSRCKERKKYGLKKARKAPQFSKR